QGFHQPPPGEPAGGLVVPAEQPRQFPPGPRGPVHADARQIPPRGASPAGLLGRLPGRAGRIRILAGGRAPPPRPFPVPAAGGWRLGDRAAGALRRVVHVTSYKLRVTSYKLQVASYTLHVTRGGERRRHRFD